MFPHIAYRTIFYMLEEAYYRTKDDEVGAFLGGMDLWAVPDDLSVDNWFESWVEIMKVDPLDTSIEAASALPAMATLLRKMYTGEPNVWRLADELDSYAARTPSTYWPSGVYDAWNRAHSRVVGLT